METVLVTGGAGFIGCVLVPHLLAQGYKVRVLDLFRHQNPGLAACCLNFNFQAIKGDCRNAATLDAALHGVDWIIPLAAVVGAPACDLDPYTAQSVNQQAIERLLKLRSKDQRILYPATNSGYGTSKPGEVCTEDTPLKPISLYGRTKTLAEKMIFNEGNCITFRLATAFGASPRMRLDLLVNDFVYRAARDGYVTLYEALFRRNFVHVYDITRAFLYGMNHWEEMKNETYNVGLPDSLTKKELYELIKEVVTRFTYFEENSKEDPDKRDYEVSVEKLRKKGFAAEVSLRWGIKELLSLYEMMPGQEFTNLR